MKRGFRIRELGAKQAALVTLAVFLFASAFVRIMPFVPPAFALAQEAVEGGPETAAPKDPNPILAVSSFDDDGLNELLAQTLKKQKDLREREAAVAQRETELDAKEQTVRNLIEDLKQADDALAETIETARKVFEEDVAQLAKVYEEMKPKQASALFSEMDPKFAAGFLANMNPETSASILENMDPKIAYTISVVLAGRNAEVPTE